MRWRALVPFGGVAPPPRGGHALVPIASNKAFVFGGRGADGAHLGDAWILELHSTASVAAGWSGKNVDARWEQSPVRDPHAPAPAPRAASARPGRAAATAAMKKYAAGSDDDDESDASMDDESDDFSD